MGGIMPCHILNTNNLGVAWVCPPACSEGAYRIFDGQIWITRSVMEEGAIAHRRSWPILARTCVVAVCTPEAALAMPLNIWYTTVDVHMYSLE